MDAFANTFFYSESFHLATGNYFYLHPLFAFQNCPLYTQMRRESSLVEDDYFWHNLPTHRLYPRFWATQIYQAHEELFEKSFDLTFSGLIIRFSSKDACVLSVFLKFTARVLFEFSPSREMSLLGPASCEMKRLVLLFWAGHTNCFFWPLYISLRFRNVFL